MTTLQEEKVISFLEDRRVMLMQDLASIENALEQIRLAAQEWQPEWETIKIRTPKINKELPANPRPAAQHIAAEIHEELEEEDVEEEDDDDEDDNMAEQDSTEGDIEEEVEEEIEQEVEDEEEDDDYNYNSYEDVDKTPRKPGRRKKILAIFENLGRFVSADAILKQYIETADKVYDDLDAVKEKVFHTLDLLEKTGELATKRYRKDRTHTITLLGLKEWVQTAPVI